jgi:O-antigen/teichoic acid export membrane protein
MSGVLTYAFLVVAARALGPSAYGRVGVLWGAMFIVAIVGFRPLEQTLARTISDRRSRGEEVRTVLRSVAVVVAVLVVIGAAVSAATWHLLTTRLFEGRAALTALLLVGICFYGLSYLVRGVIGGVRWFGGYALNLVADGGARLALALPLVLLASERLAAAAVVGAGLVAALVPIAVGRRQLSPVLAEGDGSRFSVGRALRFATPASAIAASDQLLVNGGPLLVMLGGHGASSKAAGLVFAATMLVRAPVYVFQGLAATLLPNFTHLQATGDVSALRRSVHRTAALLTSAGLLVVVLAAVAGPFAMRTLYGDRYRASSEALAVLGLGVAFYLGAATLSQALLALDVPGAAAACWTAAGAVLVGVFFACPGSQLIRVAVSFAAAAFVLLVGLAAVLRSRIRR